MILKSLLVLVGCDVAELEAGLGKVKAKLEAHEQQFRKIGLAMTAIGGVMTAFFAKSINEAVKAEAVHAKLQQALSNVEGVAKGAAETLRRYDEVLMQTTGIEHEEMESAQAVLATMGMNEKMIAALTPRILDMAVAHSRATGEEINLTNAAATLGRAVNGHTTLLERQGVVLSEQTKLTGDFNSLLKDLDKAFGGIAAASGRTFAGQMRILKVNIGETMEQIGGRLLPILLPLVTRIGDVVKRVMDWMDAHQGLMKTLVPILAGLGALMTVLGPMVMIFPKIVAGVISLGKNLIWLATNPVALAIGAVGLLVLTIYQLREAEKDEGATLKQYGIDMRKQSADVMDLAAKKAGLTAEAYKKLLDKYHEDAQALKMSVMFGKEELISKKNLSDATEEYKTKLEKQKKAQADGTDEVKKFLENLGKLPPAYKEITKTIGETPLIGNWGKARQDLIDIFQAWNDSAAVTFSFIGRTSKSTVLKLVDDIQYMKAILKKLADESRAKFQETFAKIADTVLNITGRIGDIFSQSFTNRSIEIDNEFQKRSTVLDQTYLKEKKTIEATAATKKATIEAEAAAKTAQVEKDVTDEDKKAALFEAIQIQKNEALNALDAETKATLEKQEQDHTDAKLKIEETLDKEKKRLARDQAKVSKATNLVQAIVGTARAVVEALPNIPLSIIIGALGAIQIGKIASQPLPALAKGGFFDRPTAAIVGDVPEWVIPASKLSAAGAGGMNIQIRQSNFFYGDIKTDYDIDEISEQLARKTQEAIKRGRR